MFEFNMGNAKAFGTVNKLKCYGKLDWGNVLLEKEKVPF